MIKKLFKNNPTHIIEVTIEVSVAGNQKSTTNYTQHKNEQYALPDCPVGFTQLCFWSRGFPEGDNRATDRQSQTQTYPHRPHTHTERHRKHINRPTKTQTHTQSNTYTQTHPHPHKNSSRGVHRDIPTQTHTHTHNTEIHTQTHRHIYIYRDTDNTYTQTHTQDSHTQTQRHKHPGYTDTYPHKSTDPHRDKDTQTTQTHIDDTQACFQWAQQKTLRTSSLHTHPFSQEAVPGWLQASSNREHRVAGRAAGVRAQAAAVCPFARGSRHQWPPSPTSWL